jgi:hypothetical protein
LTTFKIDPVERHRLRRLVDGPELQKSEILVQIDLARQDRIAGGLSQTAQVHLLIKKLHHLLLGHPEGYVADVEAAGLSRDRRSDHRHGGLRRVRNDVGRNLTRRLHSLVL